MSQQGPQGRERNNGTVTTMINLKAREGTLSNIGGEMMGRGKTSVTGRDSKEEKKGESSKKVTSAERKYR